MVRRICDQWSEWRCGVCNKCKVTLSGRRHQQWRLPGHQFDYPAGTHRTFRSAHFRSRAGKQYHQAGDGVYNTELTAPFDIFQHTIFRDSIKAMNTFLVANTYDPVTTFEGIRLLPDFNYLRDSLPRIDILVVPSAEHHLDTDLEDEAMLDFVRRVDREAQFVTSHCDGAFVLAKAGLLDQIVSTTFPSDVSAMRSMFPHLDIREQVLFVHDGRYITSAGGAKSFEAALYLCEMLYGKTVARRLAQGLVIDWDLERVPHLIID